MATVEERVRERIAREKDDAQGRLVDTREEHQQIGTEYTEAFGQLTELSQAIIALDDAGEVVPTEKTVALNEAHTRVFRLMQKRTSLGAKVRDLTERIERLGSEEEFDQRVEQARRLGVASRPSGREAAIRVLLDAGGPQHYREITRVAREAGLIEMKGKTPEATMNSMLSVAARDGDTFKKVAPGVFDLIDRDKEAAARAEQATAETPAEPEAPAEQAPAKRTRKAPAKKPASRAKAPAKG